jgi:hypothetical protein
MALPKTPSESKRPAEPARQARAGIKQPSKRSSVRCDVCGGMHWTHRPLAMQCPGPPALQTRRGTAS